MTSPSTRRLLIVEDDLDLRLALTDVLTAEGYSVTAVATAEHALGLLRAATPVDVVVSDVQLPGMTGEAFLARAFDEGLLNPARALLVTAMHGYAPTTVKVPLLTKPFDIGSLLASVAAALSR